MTDQSQSRDRVTERLRGVLAAHPEVTLAYLFGSVARAQNGPLSDVDVAVLVREGTGETTRGQLEDDFCRALETDDLDVVFLDAAPQPLAYRVIREGECLLCRDARAKELFESRTVMQYLDFKPLHDRALQVVRERSTGGYSGC